MTQDLVCIGCGGEEGGGGDNFGTRITWLLR